MTTETLSLPTRLWHWSLPTKIVILLNFQQQSLLPLAVHASHVEDSCYNDKLLL